MVAPSSSPTPLAGVRVVELGALVAAPYCGMLLADLGADVVKIEPMEGETSRQFGPFIQDESAFFLSVNRGKRSVALDVRRPEGLDWARLLIDQSDVVFHNFRHGVASRLHLDYESLSVDHPELIYCAISAFGPTGPLSHRPGIDLIFQGESGMMSITGEEGQPPQKTATNVADVYAGTNAALCILAALAERNRTGRGTKIDVSLRDGIISMQATWNALFFADGTQPPRTGTSSPFTAPTQTFPTADGWLNVAVVSDRHWQRLCEALEMEPAVGEHPDFATNTLRVENQHRIAEIVGDVFEGHTTDHWLEILDRAGLPAGRVMSFGEVFADAQVRHNDMAVEFDHPEAGTVTTAGTPFWFGGTKAISPRPPPALGADTEQILAELGCSDGDLQALRQANVIPQRRP